MSKVPCNVIRDLLPSYVDQICSKESQEFVNEHLAECKDCSDYLKRISSNNDKLKLNEKEDFDYMKKIRRHLDLRSLLFMVLIIIITAWFSSYSINHGNQYQTFFILLPLVLICNYFMFSQTASPQKEMERKTAYIIGGFEVIATGYVLTLMKTIVPHWIQNMRNGKKIPFGLELNQLGPFVNWQYLIIMILALAIWCYIIRLHIRKNVFHMAASCGSIVLMYCCIYSRFVLKTLDEPGYLDTACNRGVLLVGEGVLVILVMKLADWIRKKRA